MGVQVIELDLGNRNWRYNLRKLEYVKSHFSFTKTVKNHKQTINCMVPVNLHLSTKLLQQTFVIFESVLSKILIRIFQKTLFTYKFQIISDGRYTL